MKSRPTTRHTPSALSWKTGNRSETEDESAWLSLCNLERIVIMTINIGIYQTLISQLEKLRKHNRQGSIKTKERYYQAMLRFCRYLANEWRLQKLANIAPKHFEAYTEHLKKTGKSASTVKTDLAAIRFYHDLV
jgi:hypothetical protein